MDRRIFLLGFLGSMAAAPTIVAASSTVDAASLPEVLLPLSRAAPEPGLSSGQADVDLSKVTSDWSQYWYRHRRRVYRRVYRRGYRRAYRRAYWAPYGYRRRCTCY